MPLVNKSELAKILGVSLPKLARMIDRNPDMPVAHKGRSGDAWRFDADAVTEFLRAQQAEAAKEAASRSELLSEIEASGLPLAQQLSELTPAVLTAVKTRMLLTREAREAGLLVSVADVRSALNAPVAGLAQSLDAFPSRAGRRHNLPAAVVEEMARDLDDLRAAFVRSLDASLRPDAAA